MRRIILSLVALALTSIALPAAAQVSANLPVTCSVANPSNCVQATPVTNPDGTTIGAGGGGGDATAANQTTQITAANLTNTTLGAVTASPTANTIGDRLKTINTTLGTPFQVGGSIGNTTFASTQSGTWNITNISGTISLPTGAATETTLAAQSAKLPSSLGAKVGTGSLSVIPASDGFKTIPSDIAGRTGGLPTYIATITGYAAYATPQDMVGIFGSASKTVVVTRITVYANATAAILTNFQFIRRSTANSGGSPTALAIIKNDSANPTASAAPVVYGAAPTLGTSAGVFSYTSVAISASTGAPTPITPFSGGANTTPLGIATQLVDSRQPLVLRGTNEGFVVNFAGVALPVGFSATILIEWYEY